MSPESLIAACAFGFIALVPILVGINTAFCMRLKRFERSTWEALGEPMPFVNLFISHFADVRIYLKAGSHKHLGDSVSRKLGSLVLAFEQIFLWFILIAVTIVGYIVIFIEP